MDLNGVFGLLNCKLGEDHDLDVVVSDEWKAFMETSSFMPVMQSL